MRIRNLFLLVAACGFSVATLSAQVADDSEFKMEQFKVLHPDARFHGKQYYDDEGFFEQVGTADMIFGTELATGDSPEASAWNFYGQIEGIYASEAGELVPDQSAKTGSLQGAMWNKQTKTHKFYTFRFHQTMGGIPVYRSGIGFLVRNEDQFPVVMASNNLKEMEGFDVGPAAGVAPKATEAMISNTAKLMDDAPPFQGAPVVRSVLQGAPKAKRLPVNVSDEQLVIWAGVSNVRVEPELAITFLAERGTARNPDTFRRHLVVAAVDNGEVLYSENQIVADVAGTVSGNATDGRSALECDPEVPFGLPYAQVEIVGGQTVFADANGAFNIPSGAAGNVTVRSPLRGQWFSVQDDITGGTTPSIDVSVANGGTANILHNPTPTQFPTSNVNVYYRANEVRDFVLSFEPNYPTIANQTFFSVTSNNDNLSGITSCNATYSGTAINFMRNGGGCNNTSIADVVHHEYGHHLIAVTGNGQGQMGEGSGDTMGVLIEDHPLLGEGFNVGQCLNGIRSAENFRAFPCNGQIHDCGQLISGCVWDTINAIRVTDPNNARDITAQLFIGMLIVRGQMSPGNSTIGPEITLIFLELDDNDGNISNGTPHYLPIATAFNEHNMMAPELDAIDITFPNGLPSMIQPAGGTSFAVDVSSIVSIPAPGTGILHVDSGSGFQQFPMTPTDADSYLAVFPAVDCGIEVAYFVTVQAQNGQVVARPDDAPGAGVFNAFSATGMSLVFSDSFDTNLNWTVSGNATDGPWERAIPNNGDRGDPAIDAEETGAGFCFVTDNGNTGGNDNTDVDGGNTILTSPILDATSAAEDIAILSYFRWYSNSSGGSPFEDVFVVEISNNGGASWTNLETIGPAGPEVSGGWIMTQHIIADTIAPTNQMRVRFNASDAGNGSVVEAGVDAVQIQILGCGSDIVLGDLNGDGLVNLLDISLFVDLLTSGGFQIEGDINMDGVVNLLDVSLFVDLLTG